MEEKSSLILTDSDVRASCALLSSERIAAFLAITGSERDAIGLHQQMLKVSSALMPATALIEIALRNAVCERLRAMFGNPDWLQNPPAPFLWRGEETDALRRAMRQAQRAAYAKLSQSDKKGLELSAYPTGVPLHLTHELRVKARQKQISVNQGQIIAHLTLMFWKRLFSPDYEATLWKRSLKRVFPDKSLTRAQIAQPLEEVYQARNRVAHHEPLYGSRLDRTLRAMDFICAALGSKTDDGQTTLEKLQEPFRTKLQTEADALSEMLSRFSFK